MTPKPKSKSRRIEEIKREQSGVQARYEEGKISKTGYDYLMKGYDEELRALGAQRTG